MAIPIVIIHKHDSHYLPYCLAQATWSNPASDIFLMGDANNNHYGFVRHASILDYFKDAKAFGQVYKHLSTNIQSFEIFCFQRWFVLRDFMRANKLDSCVHIDSDLMVYANLTTEQTKFSHYDFTVTRGYSGHCSFFNNLAALEQFCEFIIDLYKQPELLEILEAKYQQTLQTNATGGVSDMVAFEQYRLRNEGKIGEMAQIVDDSVYDCNVKISDGFEMQNSMKNIYWIDNFPFCKHLESGKSIKFNSLHFQGSSKALISQYYRSKDFKLNTSLYSSMIQSRLKQASRYLKRFKK